MHDYTLAMGYDTIHNITSKDQVHNRTTDGSTVAEQKTTYNFAYTYGSAKLHAATVIGDRTFTYDANGNQLGWDHNQNGLFSLRFSLPTNNRAADRSRGMKKIVFRLLYTSCQSLMLLLRLQNPHL